MSNPLREKYVRKYADKYIFCPGCGHGIVMQAFARTVEKMGNKEDIGLVSGIGCSSYIPVYSNFDSIHSIHGRALSVATGLKLARPDKKVVVFTGDGDCTAIGGNHLIHAARRNIDLTVVMLNNNIYGMTGGQQAPTTPVGANTKTSPHGNIEPTFDVANLIIAAGGTKVSRWTVAQPNQLEKAIEAGINHKGFSFIEVYSQCPVQAGRNILGDSNPWNMMQMYKNQGRVVKTLEGFDYSDGKIPYGDFFHITDRVDYTTALQSMKEKL